MNKKIAVILAGCGRWDGSEVHESVLTLLSIVQNGGSYKCFSLNKDQYHVYNHLTEQNDPTDKRNMLIESARIARGDIKSLDTINIQDYAGLIIPGGNGTAFNLFSLAYEGPAYTVDDLVKNTCLDFSRLNKPVGFICIAPAMIPVIYGSQVEFTIGNDKATMDLLVNKGGNPHAHTVTEIHIDYAHKIVSTPAYMLATDINQAYVGIKKLVDQIFQFITTPT